MEKITLTRDLPVVKCDVCGALMVNLDENELHRGQLSQLKKKGIKVSNPNTEKPVCISCDVPSLAKKLKDWWDSDDDDDSSFFGYTPSHRSYSSPSSFGGFGGFGGGGFSGGGAGRGF